MTFNITSNESEYIFTILEPIVRAHDDYWFFNLFMTVIVPVIFGVISVIGLIANIIVITVISCNQQMHSTTNYLIVNLSISDILFLVFCAPYTGYEYASIRWPFGDWACKLSQYVIYVTFHNSIYTLVLMAVDRFIAVVYPVSGMSFRTDRNTFGAIVLLWIISLSSSVPVLFYFEETVYTHIGIEKSTCMLIGSHRNNKIFVCVIFLTSYVAPLILIAFLYGGMLARLWRNVPGRRTAGESRVRATRMVTFVIASFILCWTGTHIIMLLKAFDLYPNTKIGNYIQVTFQILSYLTACSNPIVYAICSETFKRAFMQKMK